MRAFDPAVAVEQCSKCGCEHYANPRLPEYRPACRGCHERIVWPCQHCGYPITTATMDAQP